MKNQKTFTRMLSSARAMGADFVRGAITELNHQVESLKEILKDDPSASDDQKRSARMAMDDDSTLIHNWLKAEGLIQPSSLSLPKN